MKLPAQVIAEVMRGEYSSVTPHDIIHALAKAGYVIVSTPEIEHTAPVDDVDSYKVTPLHDDHYHVFRMHGVVGTKLFDIKHRVLHPECAQQPMRAWIEQDIARKYGQELVEYLLNHKRGRERDGTDEAA